MDDAANGLPAVCSGCGKRYRVRSRESTVRCKACGGALVIDTAGGQPAQRDDARAPRSDPSAERIRNKEEAYEASQQIRSARKVLSLVRFWFGLSAVLLTLVAAGSWSNAIPYLTGERGTSDRIDLLAICVVVTASAAVAACGFVFVRRAPVPWTLVIAVLQTLRTTSMILFEEPSIGTLAVSLFFAVGWWCLLVPVMRVQRVVREHPELYAARQFLQESGSSQRSGAHRAERLSRERSSSARRVLIIAGVIAGCLAISAFVSWSRKPPEFGSRPQELRTAWSLHGSTAVLTFMAEPERAAKGEVVLRAIAEAGWDRVPMLSAAEPVVADIGDGKRKTASFEGEQGPLVTTWKLEGREWVLDELRTPLTDQPQRFREAWNRNDVAAIVGAFGSPERIEGPLRRTIAKRGWTAALPRAEPPLVLPIAETAFEAAYATPEGRLVVKWRFLDARWVATSLDPP